jgi:alkaline phosphatase
MVFFLMVEGSQIDWAGHANDSEQILKEMADFDEAIGVALEVCTKRWKYTCHSHG